MSISTTLLSKIRLVGRNDLDQRYAFCSVSQTVDTPRDPQATVIMDADLDTLWRPLTQHALRKRPLTIVEGHRCTVVDSEGKEYFDAIAGLWCVNVGYGQQ